MQLALFDTPAAIDPSTLVGRTDPDTSREAVQALDASGGLNRQRAEVLTALKEHGPCTACELAATSGLDRFTCSRRLPELARPNVNLVVRLEPRVCRVAGTKQTVWRAT